MSILQMHRDRPKLSLGDLAAEFHTSRKQIRRVLRQWAGFDFSQIAQTRDSELWAMSLLLYRHGYLAVEVGEFVRLVDALPKPPTTATVMRHLRYEAEFDGKGELIAHEKRHRDRLYAYWPTVKDLAASYLRWRAWKKEDGGKVDFEEVLRLHAPPVEDVSLLRG